MQEMQEEILIKCQKKGWVFRVTGAYIRTIRSLYERKTLNCEYCGEKAVLITDKVKAINGHEIVPE